MNDKYFILNKRVIALNNLCFCNFSGQVITPDDPRYEYARQEWNRSIQKYPLAIAYCENNNDVSCAINWATTHDVDIRIRSRGHNYEGFSVGNKVLVIDVSPMNQIQINHYDKTVKVEGGVKNAELYNCVSGEGYPFPGGTCPTVGVAPYTLGGGWGLSDRYFGLGCDSLIELELIDYTGRLIVANSRKNSDLFWACRGGGGGNFGVVVSLTFKLPNKVDRVSLLRVYYEDTPREIQLEFLKVWQKWIHISDDRINLKSSLYNSAEDGIGILVIGIFYGYPEEAKEILEPFYNIEGAQVEIEYMTFLEAITEIEQTYPPYEKFKDTGRFVQRTYSDYELGRIIESINKPRPRGSIYTAISLYGLGGKVSDVNKYDTAFYYRNSRYILGIQSVWEDNSFKAINTRWVEDNFRYIYAITRGSYVNFPYSELWDYEEDYYGENKYRLKQIKRKYDPYNIFNFPQSIIGYDY